MKSLVCLLMLWATMTQAHEVHHHIVAAQVVVVTLTYANGEPFAYEKYALTPMGQETPQQVGNTDAKGRIAFVAGATEKWRLQASSADGHGLNLDFSAPAIQTKEAAQEPAVPRWLLGGFGLSLIFGLFGLVQLFGRNNA